MAKYEDMICDAIETIVQNAVANAKFDRTIQATIISCENAAKAEGATITDGGKDWKVTAAAGVKTETVKTVTKSAAEAIDKELSGEI